MRLTLALFVCSLPAGLFAQTAPRFDISALDRAANPCVDFYRYACGTWMAQHPIPSDLAQFGRMTEVAEHNRLLLRDILEKASAPAPGRTAVEQKIGDYYAACMDERAIEELGAAPLKPELDRIAAIADRAGLAAAIAHLHRLGVGGLFRFGAAADQRDSSRMIATLGQGGLSLPDRDYYLKDDPKSAQIREQYVRHVREMFQLLGDAPDAAAAKAQVVMDLETTLAKASLDRVSLRDPAKRYHKMSRHELGSLGPEFNWDRYFEAVGAPAFDEMNIAVPSFVRGVDALLNRTPLDRWKVYLTWHLVHSQASVLPSAFAKSNFEFFSRTLAGVREMPPRWKRCVLATDNELGEALGQKYVERAFGAEGKQRTLAMVAALEKAMERDIRDLPWMTADTKKQALAKLHAIANKIGYPDRWRDYTALRVGRADAFGNSLRAAEFEHDWDIRKIGTATDPKEWRMTPPTVNAYYSSAENNINFPAGILQPPFFDRTIDDAVNFGAIGSVIGHELTHGFDDQGRKFDARGNFNDWWTAGDAREFEKRAACISDQYAQYLAAAGVHLNGKLTLGENTADNGGVRIAYMALMDTLAGKPQPAVDGFTPAQRFFLGWGQVWCQNRTEQDARLRAVTDPHSPARDRVNGVVSNMPEFRVAFGCTEGQPMVRAEACRVW